jgi:hypothetical protein
MIPSIATFSSLLTPVPAARTIALRPLMPVEAGVRTGPQRHEPREEPRAGGAQGDSTGQAGSQWQPSGASRPRADKPASPRSQDQSYVIAFTPEFLAQVLGQYGAAAHSPEEFDEAARAYRRLQDERDDALLFDQPQHVDFDA